MQPKFKKIYIFEIINIICQILESALRQYDQKNSQIRIKKISFINIIDLDIIGKYINYLVKNNR